MKKELADIKEERDILKKAIHLLKEKCYRYAFIEKYEMKYTIEKMCNVLRVLRSGYYVWKKRDKGKEKEKQDEITRLTVFICNY